MKSLIISAIIIYTFCSHPTTIYGNPQNDSLLYVHFINVGQGDATLIEFPCGAVLIDAGAQDNDYVDSLLIYLTDFFNERTDLNKTLESIIITHNHPDHVNGLKEVIQAFNVKRLIHNGTANGTGRGDLNWAIKNSNDYDYSIYTISFEEIIDNSNKDGLTNAIIDPIDCIDIDPIITVISSRFEENPGWAHSDYDNENNQSMVIRIDFNESSFLFTGDLEQEGIEKVISYYSLDDGTTSNLLDVDVYQIGHHGSHNATTVDLLNSMTPEIAVISVGQWDYGKDGNNHFTTWYYGHPRISTIDLLKLSLDKYRSTSKNAMVANGARSFEEVTIRKKIYATAWDRNIIIRATPSGSFRVTRNN